MKVNINKIAASAALLNERVQNNNTTSETNLHRSDLQVDIDDELLDELLSYYRPEKVKQYVNSTDWLKDANLPDWSLEFGSMVESLTEFDSQNIEISDSTDEYPFEEIFSRIVEYSYSRFVEGVNEQYLSDAAVKDLKNHLLTRLVECGGRALHLDFLLYIYGKDPEIIEQNRRSSDSTDLYDEYVEHFFDGRIGSFFEEFPMLARITTILTKQWGEATSNFVSRLNDDFHSLQSLVDDPELGQIIEIEAGAGDPHEDGRTVFIIEFTSGAEVVYKPRDIAPEKAFYGFVSWLNQRFEDFPKLQTPAVLSKSTYGWVEKVNSTMFTRLSDVKEYYKRTGALLFILDVLEMTDGHCDNVIANRASPVIVDPETILQPNTPISHIDSENRNEKLREHAIRSSVLKTMMLPFGMNDFKNTQSGLGMIEEIELNVQEVVWTNLNTDAMDFEYHQRNKNPEKNYPTYRNNPAPPSQFVEDIIAGFDDAYDIIMSSQSEIKERISSMFQGITVRKILQGTTLYQLLLDTVSSPEYLRSGVKFECKTRSTLADRWSDSSFVQEPNWEGDVIEQEQQAILRRDVPRFTMPTDANELRIGGMQVAENIFDGTGIETVLQKVETLSSKDKTYQNSLIRACLGSQGTTNNANSSDS